MKIKAWLIRVWYDPVLSKIIAVALTSGGVAAWAKIKSLNLIWVICLIVLICLVIIAILISLFKDNILQKFGLNVNDTNLERNFTTSGNPQIKTIVDGHYGNVYQINGVFSDDELDCDLRASALFAKNITYVYLPENKLIIYLRVNLLTKINPSQKPKWIRLDPSISIVEGDPNGDEMGFPITGMNVNGFIKTTVNIPKAVKETYGQIGWQ